MIPMGRELAVMSPIEVARHAKLKRKETGRRGGGGGGGSG